VLATSKQWSFFGDDL